MRLSYTFLALSPLVAAWGCGGSRSSSRSPSGSFGSIPNFWQTVEVGLAASNGRISPSVRAATPRGIQIGPGADEGRPPPEYAPKVISVPINNNKPAADKAVGADRAKFNYRDNLGDATDVGDKE